MNKIAIYVQELEKKSLGTFKPTRQWYDKMGIGQKRWKLLINNEAEPTAREIKNLANFFGCKIADLYDFEPELMTA